MTISPYWSDLPRKARYTLLMKHAHAAHSSMPNTAGFAHPKRNVAALGVEPGMHVADFGSGSGAYVYAIAEHLAGAGVVYAVDIQKDLLRRIHNEAVRKGLATVQILWGDLEKPHGSKLADHSIDLVLISNLLFQVEHKPQLFKEAHRILKSHGKLVVIDWQESFGGMGPIKQHVVDKAAALAYAETNGFKFSSEFDAGAHHYGITLKPVHNHA